MHFESKNMSILESYKYVTRYTTNDGFSHCTGPLYDMSVSNVSRFTSQHHQEDQCNP